jgi:DNA-binding NtrC family response regulator
MRPSLYLVPTRPRVLYVDDDRGNRQAFIAAFRKEFDVLTASTAEEAWEILAQGHVHVTIADQRMPGMKGSEFLAMVRHRFPRVKRMLVTAYADMQAVVDALNMGGVCFYIQKPWEVDAVRKAVMQAFIESNDEAERTAFTERLIENNKQLEFALRQSLLS